MEQAWRTTVRLDELADRRSTRVDVDGEDVLLARDGDRLFAVSARCTHQRAPLERGRLRFGAIDQVTCPVHGSVFSLADGRVLRSPATERLASYDVRISDGVVEVRRRD